MNNMKLLPEVVYDFNLLLEVSCVPCVLPCVPCGAFFTTRNTRKYTRDTMQDAYSI